MSKFNELYETLEEAFTNASKYDQMDLPSLQPGFQISKHATTDGGEMTVSYGETYDDPAPTVIFTYTSDDYYDPLYFVAYDVKNAKTLAKKVEKLFTTDKNIWNELEKLGIKYDDNGAYGRSDIEWFQDNVFFN